MPSTLSCFIVSLIIVRDLTPKQTQEPISVYEINPLIPSDALTDTIGSVRAVLSTLVCISTKDGITNKTRYDGCISSTFSLFLVSFDEFQALIERLIPRHQNAPEAQL